MKDAREPPPFIEPNSLMWHHNVLGRMIEKHREIGKELPLEMSSKILLVEQPQVVQFGESVPLFLSAHQGKDGLMYVVVHPYGSDSNFKMKNGDKIGRDHEKCELSIKNPTVSRQHAFIEVEEGRVFLKEDLEHPSTNGTFVASISSLSGSLAQNAI